MKHRYFLTYFILVFACLGYESAFSQEPAYFILGEEQFKGVQIYDVVQDKDQNYWISTDEGIYLYDFYSYKKIEAENTKNNAVFHFVVAPNGTIYCHNIANQIFQISNKTCKLFYEVPSDYSVPDIQLETTAKGNLIIVSKGVEVINPKGKRIMSYFKPNEFLSLISKMKDKSVLFRVRESRKVLRLKDGKFAAKTLNTTIDTKNLQLVQLQEDAFVIENSKNKAYRYDFDKNVLIPFKLGGKHQFSERLRFYQTSKHIWGASGTSGVTLYSENFNSPLEQTLFNNFFISDVFEDKEGNILLGTFDNGIVVIPDLKVPGVIPSFSSGEVLALYSDKDLGLVFGTSLGELVVRKKNRYSPLIPLSELSDRAIEGIYGSNESSFLIIGNGGVLAFLKNTRQLIKIADASLKDVVFVSDKEFYLATNKGLFFVKRTGDKSFNCTLVKKIDYRVYALGYDEQSSTLYISSAKGLLRMRANQIEEVRYQNQQLFVDDFCTIDGIVCAATRKHGIIKFRNNRISGSILPKVDGELESINKFIFSDHYLFAATSNGFFQFTEDGSLVNSLHTTNSFASKRVFDFTVQSDKLWVSHYGGIQELNYHYHVPASETVKLRISKLLVNNEEVPKLDGEISRQSKVQFVLSLPTLRNKNNSHYHFKLNGYDEFWQVAKFNENVITYNGLQPGNYEFLVRNENEGKFGKTISYAFAIPQPFYLRWWFIAGILVLIVLGFSRIIKQVRFRQEQVYQKQTDREKAQWKKLQLVLGSKKMEEAFHTINDLTLKGKTDQSEEFISNYKHFTEQTILFAKKDFVALSAETDLLITYLNMVRLQVREFNFQLVSTVPDSSIEVPNGLILSFLEELVEKELRGKNGPKQLHISFSLSDRLVCTMAHNVIGTTRVTENYSDAFAAFSQNFSRTDEKLHGILTYKVETEQLENQIVSAKLILNIPYSAGK